MKISDLIQALETEAHPSLQESYDNSGLLIGNAAAGCTGVLVSLDVTEEVIAEAVENHCNLVVAHHPLIFRGLKRINGKNTVERTVLAAVKNDIAVYCIHTNLDNVIRGVNRSIAQKLGLMDCKSLLPKENTLQKIVTFVPSAYAGQVRDSLFTAGVGSIGRYDECSFNVEGSGTFRPQQGSHPFTGEEGKRHIEKEIRIEAIFPFYRQEAITTALKEAHPYEEVAFYIESLQNSHEDTGSGLIGTLSSQITESQLFEILKEQFGLSVIKHTALLHKKVGKVAVCGGAGIFLLPQAIASGADVFITSDIKYHDFFDADQKILLADIGHFESEQFAIQLIADLLHEKFPTFAVLKTKINTNPVHYFI